MRSQDKIFYYGMISLHMGILSVTHLRGGQRDIWGFEAFCLPFSGTEGPLKVSMILNGQTSALKSRDKIFYYGMISLWEY